jgi:hypothetical protein
MKELSPKELATVVAKQSTGVSVKHGHSNGGDVLHLIHRKMRQAQTIPATLVAWNLHEWNDSPPYPMPKETTA